MTATNPKPTDLRNAVTYEDGRPPSQTLQNQNAYD